MFRFVRGASGQVALVVVRKLLDLEQLLNGLDSLILAGSTLWSVGRGLVFLDEYDSMQISDPLLTLRGPAYEAHAFADERRNDIQKNR